MPERDMQSFATNSSTSYTIRVEGVLDESWSEWLNGMTVSHERNGTTVISGQVVDQAALHRVIRKLRDLGTSLISMQRSES